MSHLNKSQKVPKQWYRPEKQVCPECGYRLKRSHILWHKRLIFLTGPVDVASWAYQCPNPACLHIGQIYRSSKAEQLHLKYRRYSREVIITLGYRRFWQHQTIYELHDWLSQELGLPISARQVLNLIGDFLALLRAAQPAKIRQQLQQVQGLLIGLDGMQPEKGNTCLYVVREVQLGLTLMTENLEESSTPTMVERLFEPLKTLAVEVGLPWLGVVSDAQRTIRLAMAESLPDVPHQYCQFHCLRTAGSLTFEADRKIKKQLKTPLRERLTRLEQRLTALPETDPYQAVLLDYADAIRTALLVSGIAPFDLGGVWLFEALADLVQSLDRCQKKAIIPFSVA